MSDNPANDQTAKNPLVVAAELARDGQVIAAMERLHRGNVAAELRLRPDVSESVAWRAHIDLGGGGGSQGFAPTAGDALATAVAAALA